MDYSVKMREESGFTLVELAVVMIIIGILIGGILKGQEMITNARVTSTIAQMEAISAAKNDFQNQYNALPGDFSTATTSLNGCQAGGTYTACANGDGLGSIGTGAGVVVTPGAALAANEARSFFVHLTAAGYISGMTGRLPGAGAAAFGSTHPTTPLGGGFAVGQTLTGAANQLATVGVTVRPGVYIDVRNVIAATTAANVLLTPTQAQRIDTKLDDGLVNAGGVLATTANTCMTAGTGAYAGAAQANNLCALYYRI